MFSPGDKLENGHYTVIKEIGHGGMGVVYHCHDELLQRDVAIKMLIPELMVNPDTVEIFHQEARLAAQLEHPNIVTIYQIGREERKSKAHHYIAMEYLPGGNLSAQIKHKELSVEHRLNWMKQLSTGLSYAHKRGVVHQDIKADNIFITQEGDLKIGDFGLARVAAGRAKQRAVHGMGTPAYMSPELARGEQQDHRSDIYSMGVLFFEIATGELPYKSRGMIEMAMKHASAPIPSVRKVNPLLPQVLDSLIQKMMAKDPADRYQSMADVLAVLDDLIFDLRLARLGLVGKGRFGPKGINVPGGSSFFSPPPEQAAKAPAPPATAPPVGDGGKEAAAVGAVPEATQTPADVTKAETVDLAEDLLPEVEVTVPLPEIQEERAAAAAAAEKATRVSQPVVCTRELLWTFQTKGPIGWRSQPVVSRDGSTVYVGSADGRLYALHTSSGKQIWNFSAEAQIVSSPVALPDKVLVASADGSFHALALSDGLPLWRHKGSAACVATPAVHHDTGFVGYMDGQVVALELSSGLVRWTYSAGGPVVSTPQYYGDSVYVTTREGTVHSLAAASGNRRWKASPGGSFAAAPMVSSDQIYVGGQNGKFTALDAASGRLLWEYEIDKPIVSRGIIVFTSVIFCGQDKWLYCCDKYDGHIMWKAPVRGRVNADLVAAGKDVYAVTIEGWIHAFAQEGGKLRWQFDSDRRLESSPALTDSIMLVGAVDGELLAYNLGNGEPAKR